MTLDVLVVGAGPTGLMLACELRLAGVRPVVVERLAAPTGLSKALGVTGRGVDVLDHRGLLKRVDAEAWTGGFSNFAHFAMIPLDLSRLGAEAPRGLPILQARLEHILGERATELGVEVRRGHEVVGLTQQADAVTVQVRRSGGEDTLRARYVAGCDGAHSSVRRLAGIGFPGLPPARVLRLADVTFAPGVTPPPGLIPLGDGFFRIVTNEPYPDDLDRDAPMTVDELRESFLRTRGVDLPVGGVRWMSRFTDASRLAEHYRSGRVLLAGDAAHVHLPAGGPGLSTGLQDAANLGWKLGRELRGTAPAGLLDTYHDERHPAGERVLLHTRAQGALSNTDGRTQAVREVFAELLRLDDVISLIAALTTATDTRYDMGAGPDAHPLTGRWVPDFRLRTAGGTPRVSELMHDARGLLLDLAERPDLARIGGERARVVSARCEGTPPADGVLIRPDGYVAWAGGDEPGLRAALARWFGPEGG